MPDQPLLTCDVCGDSPAYEVRFYTGRRRIGGTVVCETHLQELTRGAKSQKTTASRRRKAADKAPAR